MLKYVMIAVVAYYAHYLYINHTHSDVLVLIKTNEKFDVKAVGMLSHTDSVHKIQYISINTQKWNYAVLAKSFLDDESRKNYVLTLGYLNFVEEVKEINLYAYPATVKYGFNIFFKIWKVVGGIIGHVPARPLKPSKTPVAKCSEKEKERNTIVSVISLMRVRNWEALKPVSNLCLYKAWPAIGSEMFYTGKPESDHWNIFGIQSYTLKALCEFSESEMLASVQDSKQKAVEDENYYTVVQVL